MAAARSGSGPLPPRWPSSRLSRRGLDGFARPCDDLSVYDIGGGSALTDRRGVIRKVVLIVVLAALGVPVFTAIVADHPEPRWFAALGTAGIVGALGGLIVLVVDSVRTYTHRDGYFFPDRLHPGDEIPDELIDRIRIPGWLTVITTAILVLVLEPVLDTFHEPWWLDSAAGGAVIGCSIIVENAIWSLCRRLRNRLATSHRPI